MTSSDPASSPLDRPLAALLLAAGAALVIVELRGQLRPADGACAALAVCAAAVPPVRRACLRWLEPLRAPGPAGRRLVAAALAAAGFVMFLALSAAQARDLRPSFHDEFSYLVGARQLARGRLWYPAHPCPDFFDSFYLIAAPVYASIYFPGTALVNVPAAWLGLPTWVVPLAATSLCAALLYLVVTELLDGAAGLLAAAMLLALPIVDEFSVRVMSAIPMLLLATASVLAWLSWRRRPAAGRGAVLGAVAGWAMVTRPIDAAVFLVPIGIAVLARLRREQGAAVAGRHLAVMFAAAAPFVAAQVALDVRVTGHCLVTPHEAVTAREFPGMTYGWAHGPPSRPRVRLPQKLALYDLFYVPMLRDAAARSRWAVFAQTRFPAAMRATLVSPLLLALLPVGLLGWRGGGRAVVAATVPLFFLAYALYPAFLDHYAIVLIPGVAVTALSGARALAAAWPRRGGAIEVAVASFILLACGAAVARTARLGAEHFFRGPTLALADERIRRSAPPPAVVLFNFDPRNDPNEEPVYNPDVPWPDDAPVIRAHDLGPRDVEIYRYYARTQPDRVFYRFDRSTASLTRLGPAGEMARGGGP